MTRVAVLRCGKLPRFVTWDVPNLDELFEEDALLLRGLEAQGFSARPVVWSEPHIDWNEFDVALIRSTWDYLDEQDRFLQVLSDVEVSACRLFNPLEAVRWNIDKRYLFDLQAWGIPIVPTCLASNTDWDTLNALCRPGTGGASADFILKPTVGLGGAGAHRVAAADIGRVLQALRQEGALERYLVQPFVESVISEGEWSFIYVDRELSHVLLKRPAADDYRVQGIYGGTAHAATPTSRDLVQVGSILSRIPFDLLYARIDLVRLGGTLVVMEVEVIEPILGFVHVQESVARLVRAIRRRCASA